MSVTKDVHDDFNHSFTEHGYVIGVCCLRYDHSYPQGLERFWSRRSTTDFYLPVFANLGEQPVRACEIYADSSTMNSESAFGYQEAWADYRFKPDRVSGEMRPVLVILLHLGILLTITILGLLFLMAGSEKIKRMSIALLL